RYFSTPRDIAVYLPPDYAKDRGRYPVLYMQDGQNLFDPETAFGGQDWRAEVAADDLIVRGVIEPIVIVGVYHTGASRIGESTPARGRYGRFLARELKPFIDRAYRTRRGSADTAVGGSSMGGLVSLEAGLRLPSVFGKVAAMSPSVWCDGRSILGAV